MVKDKEEYQQLLSDLIQKEMIMLGPNLVLSKSRQVPGLKVNDEGNVVNISGDPHEVLERLANVFWDLSGHTAQVALTSLLEKYPVIKKLDTKPS